MVRVRVPDAVIAAPAELIASYGTPPNLLELVDWLRGLGVIDVAMKSTGVLETHFVQSVRAASRTKGTCLSERYRQVMRRRGDAKAVVALGHEILLSAYRLLDTAQP